MHSFDSRLEIVGEIPKNLIKEEFLPNKKNLIMKINQKILV